MSSKPNHPLMLRVHLDYSKEVHRTANVYFQESPGKVATVATVSILTEQMNFIQRGGGMLDVHIKDSGIIFSPVSRKTRERFSAYFSSLHCV